ncbi:uncharacterized protein LOC113856414 [Abrus precatorius]|uniref:Uncharacterized protein LOC113856414 n=1 Tax=Abrus precatorius TaxID=3816 RepID=A0A8B8KML4_ABRPR|nr:uncharacterized protein LOC113856414 [Abrus precatorius]
MTLLYLYICTYRTTPSFLLLPNTSSSSYPCLLLTFFSFTKAMNKFKKSQVLVLFVLLVLLVIIPSLPSSLRPTYLYFITNFLIIALGAEAGLLSVFAKPLEDKKQSSSVTIKPVMPSEASPEKREASNSITTCVSVVSDHAENCASDSGVCVTKVDKVQKGPSVPSLFFIGSGEAEEDVMIEEELEAEEDIGGINGQELFAKAEAFIRNFYKQLKMQREESWIYQKAL